MKYALPKAAYNLVGETELGEAAFLRGADEMQEAFCPPFTAQKPCLEGVFLYLALKVGGGHPNTSD